MHMDTSRFDEDLRLIHAIKSDQSDEAFEALYRKYYKLVLFIANRECANDSDAQDILQETFIEIKKSITHLRNPQYFRLWLYRVVNSKCKDLFRSRKVVWVDSDNDFVQNYIREEHRDALPDTHMKFSSDQDVMMHLIDELPHRQRIVLFMYYLEQRSIKEIAEILEIPEGTVKSRMSTAKVALKGKIEQYEHQEQVKLSFHSLDILLAQVLYASAKKVGGAAVPLGWKFSRQFRLQSFGKEAMWITVSLAVAGTITLGYRMQNVDQGIANQPFREVNHEGRMLSTSTDAYFYLLGRACCEEEIEQMDLEELKRLQNVYESIKEEKGYHYRLLEKMGWVDAFERRMDM